MLDLQARIVEILANIIRGSEIHIVDIEVRRQNRMIVCRIYLDTISGITVGECHRIAKQLSSAIEQTGGLGADCVLEVSSPGIERPFSEEWQFRKNLGRLASITYRNEQNQDIVIDGLLENIHGGRLIIRSSAKKQSDEFVEIPMERILRGKLLVK